MNIFFIIIGWLATTITILVFAPQTIKVIKTKDTSTLSKITFPILSLGASVWTIYGSMMNQWEVSSANAVVAILSAIIIYFLFKGQVAIQIGLWLMIGISIASMPIFAFVHISESIIAKYILVIIASLCAGFGFLPQAIRVIKDKKVGSYSIWTGVLIFTCDALWAAYFSHELTNSHGSDIVLNSISLTVSVFSSSTQIPIMIIHYKSKKNKTA